MDLTTVEIAFDDGTLEAMVASISTVFDGDTTVDDDGVIRTRAGVVLLDIREGFVQFEGVRTWVQPGRYAVLPDGLYQRWS